MHTLLPDEPSINTGFVVCLSIWGLCLELFDADLIALWCTIYYFGCHSLSSTILVPYNPFRRWITLYPYCESVLLVLNIILLFHQALYLTCTDFQKTIQWISWEWHSQKWQYIFHAELIKSIIFSCTVRDDNQLRVYTLLKKTGFQDAIFFLKCDQ